MDIKHDEQEDKVLRNLTISILESSKRKKNKTKQKMSS